MQKLKNLLVPFLTVLFVAALGTTYYFYNKTKETNVNPGTLGPKETAALIAELGKIIVLPQGEDPTIATVADLEPLKNQPFFAQAQVGDKVLLYTNARKAYLYDPKQKKLRDVATLSAGENPTPPIAQ